MNKKIITLAGITALASSLFAFDFGGSLGNYTKLGTPSNPSDSQFESFSLKQEGIFSLWLRQNFSSSSFLAAEGDVSLRYTNQEMKNSDGERLIVIPDLKTLRFFKKFDSQLGPLSLNLGRFYFTDLTGIIISQATDGFTFSLDSRHLYLKTFAHYTGLLNAQNTTIINKSKNLADYKIDFDKPYFFAPSFANAGLQLSLPYLFANQTLSAEFIASFGFDGIEKGSDGYNRYYASLGLNGFFMKNACYILTSTLATDNDFKDLSNLSKAIISFFPGFMNSILNLNFIYASGNQGSLKPFTGFTSMTACNSLFEPEYACLMKPGLSLSLKPLQNLLVTANTDIILAFAESSPEYAGTETGLNAAFQIFSDLNINAGFTEFFAKESENSKATIILSASLAF